MKTPVEQPSEEIKMKMLEFFMKTSVPRIIEEEQRKREEELSA
ncbi:hypothetical protein [Bacillus sp. CH30_1T]|nr:hypothetical protein [Bacillus sp. CH30_1T]